MEELLTDKHIKLIQKKITEAINEIDFKRLVENYIDKEFETLWDGNNIGSMLSDVIVEDLRLQLTKSGFLKGGGTNETMY
jgi:hypothetical protein